MTFAIIMTEIHGNHLNINKAYKNKHGHYCQQQDKLFRLRRCFITVAYLFEYHPFSLNCVSSEMGYPVFRGDVVYSKIKYWHYTFVED